MGVFRWEYLEGKSVFVAGKESFCCIFIAKLYGVGTLKPNPKFDGQLIRFEV